MVGFLKQEVEEVIYRKYMSEMTDEDLEGQARVYLWLTETSLGGPWKIDVWKRDLVRAEFEKRGLLERYEMVQDVIVEDAMRRGLSNRRSAVLHSDRAPHKLCYISRFGALSKTVLNP